MDQLYDIRTNEWIDIDFFREDHVEMLRDRFDAENPGCIHILDKLFKECWEDFHKRHPDIDKPMMIPVYLQDAWGACVHKQDGCNKAVILVNAKIITLFEDEQNARDIIYHELCHLIYKTDHRREFWDELENYDHVFKKQKEFRQKKGEEEFNRIIEELEL